MMVTRSSFLALLGALALGACGRIMAADPARPSATLPPDAVTGAGDPLRSAIAATAADFSNPARLAGQPAEAAQALAQMEYLAVELPGNPTLLTAMPTLPAQLAEARREWRAALGIPSQAPPQMVIDALYASARSLRAGRREEAAAALPSGLFTPGGAATLERLAALPPLPRTNAAAVAASQAERQGLEFRPAL
jgi:hypothetical protein